MRSVRCILLLAPLCLALASQAQIHLSGALSGTLGAGEYLVDSTIVVNEGATLTILGGAHLSFAGWYPFKITGTLLAQGSEQDSVIFDCDPLANPLLWHGLRFTGSGASASRLSYCRISLGNAQTYWPENSGGGIFCMSAAPIFEHCLISANTATMYGAGIYCYNGPADFLHCTIEYNLCSSQGGGIYASLSPLTIDDCLIRYNSSGNGTGGGILAISSAMTITNTVISHNSASTTGGTYLSGNPAAAITNCLVEYNSSTGG